MIYLNTSLAYEPANNNFNSPTYTPTPELLACALYNASHHTFFDVRSSGEQILTSKLTFQNWMPAFSEIPRTASDIEARRQINFQSVMQLFNNIFTGFISINATNQEDISEHASTFDMNRYLYPPGNGTTAKEDTQRYARVVERLFRNITLTQRYGQMQGLIGDSIVSTLGTRQIFQLEYVYHRVAILVPYLLSLLVTIIAMSLGFWAMHRNRASYTNRFSTIVRVTRDVKLARLVEEHDAEMGTDSLPEEIARAVLVIER